MAPPSQMYIGSGTAVCLQQHNAHTMSTEKYRSWQLLVDFETGLYTPSDSIETNVHTDGFLMEIPACSTFTVALHKYVHSIHNHSTITAVQSLWLLHITLSTRSVMNYKEISMCTAAQSTAALKYTTISWDILRKFISVRGNYSHKGHFLAKTWSLQQWVCFISCVISPNLNKIAHGRRCHAYRTHCLPQTVSLEAVLQLLRSISLHLT